VKGTTITGFSEMLSVQKTLRKPADQLKAFKEAGKVEQDINLPECNILNSGTWLGCFGKIVYWAIFQPTAKIFALTGRLLDVSVDYSTKDTSYRSVFVVEGWKIIKDFCNVPILIEKFGRPDPVRLLVLSIPNKKLIHWAARVCRKTKLFLCIC
jgi:hypothetical protein